MNITSYGSTANPYLPTTDPIAALVERTRSDKGAGPAVLSGLSVDVSIRGALALVETTRTYENREQQPIEALLSLPVPVHAAFFGLTARIGGRTLEGKAMLKHAARTEYEEAIDKGMSAVLHEELLRGVHLISVGNLAPGTQAEVTARWAMPLRLQSDRGHLRIPMTVGDVYGVSGLPDSDALEHGGAAPEATLRLQHDAQGVTLAGGALMQDADGGLSTRVPANAPIDIVVEGYRRTELTGRTWDGRRVSLTIGAAPAGTENLSVTILVDHSGSMSSPCEVGNGTRLSCHEALVKALHKAPAWLREGDQIALWEFDHDCNPIGSGLPVGPGEFARSVSLLREPSGGTEIGGALDKVRSVETKDVLLITDGMSYALDVQAQALTGRRVFVVLIGEDSLEANVGHLAALTGGDLQFSAGADVEHALKACLQGLRTLHTPDEPYDTNDEGAPVRLVTARGNATVEARWTKGSGNSKRDGFAHAVAAYAASLAVTCSEKETAADIALGEGLVTHLTSLVLTDTDGERQSGLPATRKITLPTPRAAAYHSPGAVHGPLKAYGPPPPDAIGHSMPTLYAPPASMPEPDWPIDWDTMAPGLAQGNLQGLPLIIARAVREISEATDVKLAASTLGIDALELAIALLAHQASHMSRQAERVCRRLLRNIDQTAFEKIADDFEGHPLLDWAF